MVIYISSEENKDLLSNVTEQYEWELLIEVMERGSLSTFITDRLQVINSIQYLIIERSCVKENEQQLRDLLDTIHTIWNTHIILLEEILVDESGENQRVIYEENITLLDKFQENLKDNLEFLLKGEKIPVENVYSGTWIGVMSANNGAGCTHIAIDLANYISSTGESVCYVEANESGDLGAMASFYELEQIENNHYRKGNIDYWHQMIDPEKKYAVLDIGKYNVAKMEMFNQCKIKILVTDGKPYRITDALSVLKSTKDDTTRLWLNYIKQEEYEKIHEVYLAEISNPIDRICWHESMFDGSDVVYQEALKEYIPVTTKKTSILSFMMKSDVVKKRRIHNKSDRNLQKENVENINLEDELSDESIIEEKIEEVVEIEEATSEKHFVVTDPKTDHLAHGQEDTLLDDLEQDVLVIELPKKKVMPHIKNMVITLLVVIGIGAVAMYSIQVMREEHGYFIFNNQDEQQPVTEFVDENLNINQDIKISVLEVEGADGYEVSYCTDQEFPKERTVVVEVQTADKAVESLTAGKTYYVRVRAFKYNDDGSKVYGNYTEIQKIET